MRRGSARRLRWVPALAGIPLTVWAALLLAPDVRRGLPGMVSGFLERARDPFRIVLCPDSLRTALVTLLLYALVIGAVLSSERNLRRREEHGSARWGDPRKIDRKYADPVRERNKILTQNVAVGLDGRRHKRNLNVLVCGGSGSGKTRYYAKPNILNSETSFVILDPKLWTRVILSLDMLWIAGFGRNRGDITAFSGTGGHLTYGRKGHSAV